MAAANSTCPALMQVGARYQAVSSTPLHFICKSSGRLARGLAGKAIQADIYISANAHWMGYMMAAGIVEKPHVSAPWSNQLVVAVPTSSPLTLHDLKDLARPEVTRILIGEPSHAPFGRYAKESLETLQLWQQVKPKIVTQPHITALAQRLEQADAGTVGILFQSHVTETLRVIAPVKRHLHSPIHYYVAPLGRAAEDPAVSALLYFMQSHESRAIFADAGFSVGPWR